MRPKSITWFKHLFLASIAVGVITTLINYGTVREYMLARGGAPGLALVTSGLGALVNGLLLWFILRRRSMIAKWLVTLLAVPGIVQGVSSPRAFQELGVVFTLSWIIVHGLLVAAIVMLFTRDSKAWFAAGAQAEIDPSAFD